MEDAYWCFKDIIAHQKEDPHYNGSSYNVMIKWDTGETSYEPFLIPNCPDDPITCAVYAKKRGLLNTPGWKHLKNYVKTSKRLLRAAKQFKIRQARKAIKYQFGNQIPRNYDDALRLDMENGNHKWQDAVDVGMAQIKEFESSRIMGRQNGKERPPPVLPLDTRRSEFILSLQLNNVEILRGDWLLMATSPRNQQNLCTQELFPSEDSDWYCSLLNSTHLSYGGDVGNAYLEAVTKEKLCIIAGPEFGELQGHILIIYKALYGTRTGGACWHDKLFDTLQHMGFQPSKADADIWMKPTYDRQAC